MKGIFIFWTKLNSRLFKLYNIIFSLQDSPIHIDSKIMRIGSGSTEKKSNLNTFSYENENNELKRLHEERMKRQQQKNQT